MPVKTGTSRWRATLVVAASFLFSAGAQCSFGGEGLPIPWAGPVPCEVLPWVDTIPWAGPVSCEASLPWAGPVPPEEPLPWAGPVPPEEALPWAGPVPPGEPLPWTDTVPWAGPVPSEELLPWVKPVQRGYFAAFMDRAHARMERTLLHQAVRLDDFFGNPKHPVSKQTSYELRLRNSLQIQHAWDWRLGATIRAHITLSRINDRLSLFISGEDEPGNVAPSLPSDPGSPGFDRTTPTAHFANTELRYELIQKPELNLFLGAGVRIALPFEAFVRSRVQRTHPFGDVYLYRVAETFFYNNTIRLGETTEFSIDRKFSRKTLLRWASSGTAAQGIHGLEWASELSLLHELSPKSGVTLLGGIYGNTNFSAMLQNYRLLARYRRNFLREWLFYEVEPEVTWPLESDGSRNETFAITFRIEVVFKGTAPVKDISSSATSP